MFPEKIREEEWGLCSVSQTGGRPVLEFEACEGGNQLGRATDQGLSSPQLPSAPCPPWTGSEEGREENKREKVSTAKEG